MAIVVVLASGLGKRMNAGKNKVLLTLGRKPMVYHTIKSFQDCEMITQIILVVREDEKDLFWKIVKQCGCDKVSDVIDGGSERQYSAYNAVLHLSHHKISQKEIILFHNGANPFVTSGEITAVVRSAKKHGAAAVAHPTKDTIKKVKKDGLVMETLDRSHLWNMQTPQAIRFDIAVAAFANAAKHKYLGTDDVSLVEYAGGDVKIVPASENNFKITTPRDLVVARYILQHNVHK